MNVNLSLLGQMITFIILVTFTMKYVWPPMMAALDERKKRIADGLAAAEQGHHQLEVARHQAADILRDAKIQAAERLDKATHQGHEMVEAAKLAAREEGDRLIELAKSEIEQQKVNARELLRKEAAQIALLGMEKVLSQKVDPGTNTKLLNDLMDNL